MAVLGPGYRAGVPCPIRRTDKPVVIASEGGPATLATTCERQDRIIQHLRNRSFRQRGNTLQRRQRFGHASAERAVSGAGLENIYLEITNPAAAFVGLTSISRTIEIGS
jgi:glucokinase